MVPTRVPTSDRVAGRDRRQQATAAQTVAPEVHHIRRLLHFWRHFLEMSAAMWIGMVVGGVLFKAILAAFGTTITEVRLQYPELTVLVMGVNMTVPMVAWMRHRGHGWRSSAEMGVAMFAPAIPVIALVHSDVIGFAAVCGLYCAVMMAAMLALMLYRRSEYTM
jgi:flagellar biosynthetic protein FliP